jgi:hypothetical protein
MLIKRQVFEKMMAAHPELQFSAAHVAPAPSLTPHQYAST